MRNATETHELLTLNDPDDIDRFAAVVKALHEHGCSRVCILAARDAAALKMEIETELTPEQAAALVLTEHPEWTTEWTTHYAPDLGNERPRWMLIARSALMWGLVFGAAMWLLTGLMG